MPVNYNFRSGVDIPGWQWLSFFPTGASNPGASNCYDGTRYIYWLIQSGTTATTASTTQLWRYDTWTNGWQFLATVTSGNQGIDLEYDFARNIVYFTIGAGLSNWYFFNPNSTAVTIMGQTAQPMSTSAIFAVGLPVVANPGSSLCMPNDIEIPAAVDTGIVASGSTATSLIDSTVPSSFGSGLIGLQVRFTSGALNGQHRIISATPAVNTLTVAAFTGAPAVGDTFTVELPTGTATTGSSTTVLNDTAQAWPVNYYANSDVIITGGTGVGQRRRIASNTATALTLSASTAGNPRTGPFATAPDITSTYQIVPSSDFLYYLVGNNTTTAYKIDVLATTPAWTAITALPGTAFGGANFLHPLSYAPFSMLALRGNGTNSIYLYNIGTNSWTTLPTTGFSGETLNTGASSCVISGKRKVFVQIQGSQRCLMYDLVTGSVDGAGFMPYAAPGAYEGHRARYVATPSGVSFVYIIRAGGQEFYRVPIEWLG